MLTVRVQCLRVVGTCLKIIHRVRRTATVIKLLNLSSRATLHFFQVQISFPTGRTTNTRQAYARVLIRECVANRIKSAEERLYPFLFLSRCPWMFQGSSHCFPISLCATILSVIVSLGVLVIPLQSSRNGTVVLKINQTD